MAGATRQELDQQRNALVKVINHLSWEPEIAQLKCIDEPVGTVYCLDIREVGWDKQPYDEFRGPTKREAMICSTWCCWNTPIARFTRFGNV